MLMKLTTGWSNLLIDIPVVDLVVGVFVALHEVVVDLLDGVLTRVASCLSAEAVVKWHHHRISVTR